MLLIFSNKNNQTVHFHIIGDLHLWEQNIRSHKNYVKECIDTVMLLRQYLVDKRKEHPRDLHYLIFLGDIFHRGFSNENKTVYNLYYQKFMELRSLTDDMFCVVGNHELNFPLNNPFWSLISTIEEDVQLRYVPDILGLYPIIRVIDNIQVNNSVLIFQHFDTFNNFNLDYIDYKNKFLFAHEIYMNAGLLNLIESELGENQKYRYIKYSNIIDNDPNLSIYNEAFMGHIHSIIGDWKIFWDNKHSTGLHYLGSQIPVTKDEYLYTPDYRYIKDLTIDSAGNYIIQTKSYQIPTASEALNISKIKQAEVAYKKTKDKKDLFKKHSNIKFNGQDPLELLAKEFSDDLGMFETFKLLETGVKPDELQKRLSQY